MPATRDSRGGSESISLVLLTPIIVLFLFAGLQVGLVFFARQSAVAAARAAAEQARLMPPGDANGAAQSVLSQGNVRNAAVDVQRDDATVIVTVTGQAPYVLWGSHVTGSVTFPVERLS